MSKKHEASEADSASIYRETST